MVTSEHDKLTVTLSRYPAKAYKSNGVSMQKGRHATTRAAVGRHEEGLNRTDRAGTRRASTEQTGARR